jgi:hypothetical protein
MVSGVVLVFAVPMVFAAMLSRRRRTISTRTGLEETSVASSEVSNPASAFVFAKARQNPSGDIGKG